MKFPRPRHQDAAYGSFLAVDLQAAAAARNSEGEEMRLTIARGDLLPAWILPPPLPSSNVNHNPNKNCLTRW